MMGRALYWLVTLLLAGLAMLAVLVASVYFDAKPWNSGFWSAWAVMTVCWWRHG